MTMIYLALVFTLLVGFIIVLNMVLRANDREPANLLETLEGTYVSLPNSAPVAIASNLGPPPSWSEGHDWDHPDAIEEEEDVQDTKKVTKKVMKKYKVQYYTSTPNKKMHRNGTPSTFKVRHRKDKNDTVVKVSYVSKGLGLVNSATTEVHGDEDLRVHVKLALTGGKEFSMEHFEAHDLHLALTKFFELSGEATFAKIKKP